MFILKAWNESNEYVNDKNERVYLENIQLMLEINYPGIKCEIEEIADAEQIAEKQDTQCPTFYSNSGSWQCSLPTGHTGHHKFKQNL